MWKREIILKVTQLTHDRARIRSRVKIISTLFVQFLTHLAYTMAGFLAFRPQDDHYLVRETVSGHAG